MAASNPVDDTSLTDSFLCSNNISPPLSNQIDGTLNTKSQKKTQAKQNRIYIDLRIATEENLRAHNQTTFDLVNLSEIQPQRHKKTESIEAFKARAAEVFGIPVERQRYWVFQLRKNKTTRPLRSLTARELAEPIQYLRPLQTFYTEYAQMLLLLPDDPDAASGAPRPIGKTTEDSEDYVLLFFKLFDPVASSVSYIGHGVFSLASSTVAEAEAKFRQLAGDLVPANLKLNIWEEIKPDRIDAVDSALSLKDAGLRIGDVLIFQVETAPQAAPTPYPSPVEWYSYILEPLVVEFRNFDAPEDTASTARFSLECRKSFSYEAVQKVVGQHLEADPAKILFTGFSPSIKGPRPVPCKRGVGVTLPKMIKWYNGVCPDILYYEILTARLDQIEHMKKIKIEFQCANMKSLKLINLLVPKNGVVADIFPILTDQKEVKEVLESDPALGLTFGTKEFKLLQVWNGKVGRSFKARDPVNTSFYESSIYTVQEMAPEETGSYIDSKLHKRVQVCHFQMGMYQQPLSFGKPFYIVINNYDIAFMIKEKIRLRLQLTHEDIATWKLAHIAKFRAKYLEDTQVAGELLFDDASCYLGLEHANEVPLEEFKAKTEEAPLRANEVPLKANEVPLRAHEEAHREAEKQTVRLKVESASEELERLKRELQEQKDARLKAEKRAARLEQEASNPLSQLWRESLLFNFEIPPHAVEFKEILTKKGGTGVVYSGVYHETPVAIKRLKDADNLEDLKREVRTWCRFRHPHIVPLIGFSTASSHPFIVMELMHGDLYSHLHQPSTRSPPLSFSQRFRVACCVAAGLTYIHAQNAVHRDIKSLNILLKGDFKIPGTLSFDVKIADFGATRGQETIQKTTSDVKTIGYAAPELFRAGAVATFSSDVFALSMVMYELLMLRLPFPLVLDLAQMATTLTVEKARPRLDCAAPDLDVFAHMIRPWIALIQKSWIDETEIDKRPSVRDILNELISITKIPAPPSSHVDINWDDIVEISFSDTGEVLSDVTPSPVFSSSSSPSSSLALTPDQLLAGWTVAKWLTSLELSDLIPIFEEQGLSRPVDIKALSVSDLAEIGITKVVARNRILKFAKEL